MAFQIQSKTIKWLVNIQVLAQNDIKQITTSSFQIKQNVSNSFQNGIKVAHIVMEIFKKSGLPVPQSLNHLKVSNQTAAQLYNWNILNEALKKLDFQIDPETKNMIINGDREHLAFMIRKLHDLYNKEEGDYEDSLQKEEFKKVTNNKQPQEDHHEHLKQSLTLSRSQQPPAFVSINKKNQTASNLQRLKKIQAPIKNAAKVNSVQTGDLLQYVIEQLMSVIKLTRKQAIALLSDNNKYLAHVFVKGVKNQFTEIEELMQRWFKKLDYIVQKMVEQNDMCFFFLQIIKPSLLSKSQEVAQWGCRILSRIANELANKQMLPLAYDWFVRQAGGLATTILALSRHPKLNQHVVGYILQFARYNVAELFTVQLKKITSNDQISYVKFMLLIFDPLAQSKISSEQLLTSGAIDYWTQMCLKGAEGTPQNSIAMRLYSIEFLTKIWRANPLHIEQTLDKVNDIMGFIKRGIRQSSQIMRFALLQLMFNLLDEFASKRNPYASVVYKKITFLFIQNHEQLNIRQFMLRNFSYIISKYQSIPIQIFLQPFIKQVKIRQSKSYFLNIFDMQFINVVVNHKKLKVQIALQLFDLLAKTKLNNYQFASLADSAMEILLDRFLEEDIFHQYTSKLVKISLAIFYSTFKHKKNQKVMNDQERLHAQKRSEIINFIISLIERNSDELNQQIKEYIIHLKLQIQKKLNTTHKGIQRILEMFPNIQQDINEALQIANNKDEVQSNMTSQNSKNGFHFPKLQEKYLSKDRDQTSSQQSQGTQYSKLSKQEFPQKDYTKFAEEDEQKFIKQNNIGFKKKSKPIKKPYIQKQVDPKVQQQILKKKLKKQQQQKRRLQQQQKIQKRKQQLNIKIQKQLQQRNLMQGIKGLQKDVKVKVIFDENELNQKLFDDQQLPKNININEEEYRDQQSIRLILKKYNLFLRKIFNKYSSSKVNKKDYFNEQNQNLSQIDLVRMCKQKNLQKNKQVIIELIKNNKENRSMDLQTFIKFIQNLTIYQFVKQKCSTHMPMGEYLKGMLKKMAVGENFKLQEDEDEITRSMTEKVRYNPHIQLPQNYKKVYQRVFQPKKECSYPIKKAINNQSYIQCYEVVHQLLYNAFKFQILEEQVRFFQEARVVKKTNNILPPRPNRRQEPVLLLEQKQTVPAMKKRAASNVNQTVSNRNTALLSSQRQKQNSKPKPKIINQVQKKRQEEQEQKRLKKQKQQQQYKRRQAQIKRRMQKMQQQKQRQKQRQKQETKNGRETEQQKRKKQKQQKQKYYQQQRQKVDKFKREKQQKQKQQKQKQKSLKQRQQQERRQKLKFQMKRQQQKRKQQAQKIKKDRQMSEQKNKKKKEQQQKKKQLLKKQVLKKLQGQKQKYQIQKLFKELLKKIFLQSDIQNIFSQYKQELKNMYNYGKQFNQYKLGSQNQNLLQQKGWMTLCQQFNFCDASSANTLLKQNQKQKGRTGFMYDQFLQNLLSLGVKKDIENDLDDYEKAHQASVIKLQKYLKNLKIPKDKQSMKDYFILLKNNIKKKQQIQLTAPNGQKQTWQIQQK